MFSGERENEFAQQDGSGRTTSLIPFATGVEVLDRLIDLALEGGSAGIDDAHDDAGARGHALVNFLLARPGTVHSLAGFEGNTRIVEGEYYVKPGHEQRAIVDGQGRVGYFIAHDATRAALLERAAQAYRSLSLSYADCRNLLFTPERAQLLG